MKNMIDSIVSTIFIISIFSLLAICGLYNILIIVFKIDDYLFDKKIKTRTDFKSPGQGMEKMYKYKTLVGVCSVYANYEELLFNQLGINVYQCTDDNIGHAWTVLKVKNTAGKTLWVPFDYGIGPAEKLIIKENIYQKYLRTEKMRYQLYLSKVKGAPKKKNFKISDFI